MNMIGKGLLKGLGITLGHTFEKDITIQYPEERPFLQERFRGCLNFDYKNCIICGLCIKTCPNNVLSYETSPIEGSKKKRLLTYTIDLQYCMFCNLCVEACPKKTLFFTHDFELATDQREQIKKVYVIPADAQFNEEDSTPRAITEDLGEPVQSADEASQAAAKRLKQIGAMKTALSKSPQKVLARLLEGETDVDLLSEVLAADEKKRDKIAELLIDDKDKARKVAGAYIIKEKRDREKEGGEGQ